MERIVLALGGNALGKTPEEQLKLVKHTAKVIVPLIRDGNEVVVGHGNGPQVGMIYEAFDTDDRTEAGIPKMPFPECGAMSQGYIGYQLQQAITNELSQYQLSKACATIITQVLVDKDDSAFKQPTKPIGKFVDKETADTLSIEKNYQFMEDAGRGYRQVVPSPKPIAIVESEVIEKLISSNIIVITVGGGGIPVFKSPSGYKGVPAVIDKDLSCARLAIDLQADKLIILTAVDHVFINFNTAEQQALTDVSTEQMKQYIREKQFAKGSMLPKIEACIEFVEATGGQAIITSLKCASTALNGEAGTLIE